jgi:dihydroorotate dehydrogenase
VLLSLYQLAWRPAASVIARTDAQRAHAGTVELMRQCDRLGPLTSLVGVVGHSVRSHQPTHVGRVRLAQPIIVAAGLVKGDGFPDETDAMNAVGQHRDIVPGWRSVPAMGGPVEFGSFTRQPRLGNAGRVVWRDDATRSMQNRIGLRNPGARAAAAHLQAHQSALPDTWGINLAVSPGVTDAGLARAELEEAAACFHDAFAESAHGPSWLTLNLSCPNTDDDPHGTQSADLARELCGALAAASPVPLWVKIGPDLSDAQLSGLTAAFDEAGVSAVVATNTWARPVPGSTVKAGTSGARLRPMALYTVARLRSILATSRSDIDIVACGGILDGAHWRAFQDAGARAAMIYSAMVFRGPLAAALILREAGEGGRFG